VGIFGRPNLQVEGTGAEPSDVVFDGGFHKLNVIRADHADGVYVRNLTVQRATFNAVYVIETDGFVIDGVVTRWNDEYGILSFAADHGLYANCEAYGNGDSGLYPGSTADVNRVREERVLRYAIEIRHCHSHHNLLGYSGTAGDSVWVHDSEFDSNSAGVSMDSLAPHHPGLPQNHARFEGNRIHGNNQNYYRLILDGTCARPSAERGTESGAVCASAGVPVGTGLIVGGGNWNLFTGNWVWDNSRVGFMQLWVPGFVRGEFAPQAQVESSHHNRYLSNTLGRGPDGTRRPNGVDFWWDGQGTGNCWQGNETTTSHPVRLPSCAGNGTSRLLPAPLSVVSSFVCSRYSRASGSVPLLCPWYRTPGPPGSLAIDLLTVDFMLALMQALALAPLMALFARSSVRQSGRSNAWTLAGLAGVLATLAGGAWPQMPAPAAALGLALMGCWWLLLGTKLMAGPRRLAILTLLLASAAVLEAVDTVGDLPFLPLAPAWGRAFLTCVWVPWAAATLLRHRCSLRPAH
jgi:hypothetical protein